MRCTYRYAVGTDRIEMSESIPTLYELILSTVDSLTPSRPWNYYREQVRAHLLDCGKDGKGVCVLGGGGGGWGAVEGGGMGKARRGAECGALS